MSAIVQQMTKKTEDWKLQRRQAMRTNRMPLLCSGSESFVHPFGIQFRSVRSAAME
jgi:hypothetical protein